LSTKNEKEGVLADGSLACGSLYGIWFLPYAISYMPPVLWSWLPTA